MKQAIMNSLPYPDEEPKSLLRSFQAPVLSALLLIGLSFFGYVWLHSLAELFTVVIGVSLYLVARGTFSFTRNSYLLYVATGFFWSSIIDVFHTLTYEGMSKSLTFPPDTPPLLWMCARSLQVLALLLAPRYLAGKPLERWIFPSFGALAAILVALVFARAFPVAWVALQGLTPFKIAWEWTLIFLYLIAGLHMAQHRQHLHPALYTLLRWVIALSIATELCFTWYVEMYGLSNMLGHTLKLWAYWLMLWVVSQHMLREPKRLLQEQALLLQQVTSQVPGMVYQFERTTTGDYHFTYVSPGVAEIFELTPEELAADSSLGFQRIESEALARVLEISAKSYSTLTPWQAEWQVVLPRLGRRWHRGESSIPLLRADGSCVWIAHIYDITEQKTLELELLKHRDHLSELVREQTEDLREAMQKTEQAAQAKGDFLSNMSHEIRTPLNAIIGMSAIALRAPDGTPTQAYLAQIQDSGQLLLALVNDILDMAKVEAGKLNLESRPVRLSEIIQRSMLLTVPRAEEKGLDFHLDCAPDLPEGILSDPTRLTQVLVNLLGNAIKFTEQGSIRLQVRAASTAPDACWLILSIQDSGIGMNEEQMARLFQPFEQGDSSTTRRFGGTGLGLTISKRIVDLMGGSINMASQAGMGACFTVRIPVKVIDAPPADELVLQARDASGRLKGMRILAAEDDPVNQWVLRELLEQEGALCTIKDDGRAALAVLSGQEVFDIFLTDVQMPGLNGYETARRSLVLRPDLPIIGLTAYALPEERQRCLDAGMSNHITKPVDIDTLVVAILRLVKPDTAIVSGEPPPPVLAMTPTPVENAVDWSVLEQRLVNAASRQKILESLLENHANTPAGLRRLMDGEDPEPVRQIAHNLRGVAGFLAAMQTQQAAESLENSIRDTRLLERAKVQCLADSLEATLAEVRNYLTSLADSIR